MKAVVLEKPVAAEHLKISEVPVPKVRPGWVLVRVKAFGINRSELFTRKGQSASVQLPRIIGIECVGEVADPSDSRLRKGERVLSMMGGLGRAFDGSYAEYALIPEKQVYPVDAKCDWSHLAAVPEMYYTAWCSLVDVLRLRKGERLLIRGGTSSVGLASLQLAKQFGATVIATTRTMQKAPLLYEHGADLVLTDDVRLGEQLKEHSPDGADKVLELVGATTLQSSFALLKTGGVLCMSGILGGAWNLEQFAPMDVIPSGSYFTIFDSQHVAPASLHAMLAFLQQHRIKPVIAKIFSLQEIAQAHQLMESNTANGKIVVVIDEALYEC